MIFTISKEFTFDAGHRLAGLPDGHKCGRWHGHTYRVVVEVSGCTDAVGFVLDYGELNPVKQWIEAKLDHHNLNDVDWFPAGFNPTAENLAYEIAVALVELVPPLRGMRDTERVRWRVGVSETPKTWAWCDPWAPWPPVGAPVGVTEHELTRGHTALSRVQLQPPGGVP